MSTNEYVLEHSTDSIWRENDLTRVLTDDLNTMDTLIAGKADSDHNHDGSYSALSHTHTEYAAATHNHDDLYAAKTHETNTNIHVTSTEKTDWNSKAAGNHNHDTEYAGIDHTHTDYSGINHTHSTASTTAAGFISAADKSKLDGIEAGATAYTHPTTHPASMITGLPTSLPANGGNADTVDNCHASDFASAIHDHDSDYAAISHNHNGTYAAASHAHTEYSSTSHSHNTATTEAAGFMSGTDKAKLNGIAANANNYSHPASHSASMITETDGLKIMTAAERTKLSGIAENANNYTHPTSHAASMITGLSSVATSGDYNDLSNKPTIPSAYTHPATHPASMITGLPTTLPANGGNADTVDGKHASEFATAGHNHDSSYSSINHNHDTDYAEISHIHAQSDITGLETALSEKAAASHTHTAAQVGAAASSHNHNSSYISKSLQMTADDGDVEVSWSNQDVVAKIKALGSGIHTAYAKAGTTNNPKTTESWRFMAHKTGAVTYGWVMAYGSQGSIYTGYVDNGTWQGWKCLFDANPAPLWSGGYLMTAGHTVTPSKKLSECRNGWLLLWSDYDPGVQINNTDFHADVIFKKAYTGQNWAGGEWYFDIPRYSAGTATDSESRIIKLLKIYDNKIVGTENNAVSPRNDVVLRTVYEF